MTAGLSPLPIAVEENLCGREKPERTTSAIRRRQHGKCDKPTNLTTQQKTRYMRASNTHVNFTIEGVFLWETPSGELLLHETQIAVNLDGELLACRTRLQPGLCEQPVIVVGASYCIGATPENGKPVWYPSVASKSRPAVFGIGGVGAR